MNKITREVFSIDIKKEVIPEQIITTFNFDIRSLEPGYYIISCEGYDNVEFVRTLDNVWLKKTLKGAYDLYGKIENPVNAYFKWEEIDKVYIKREIENMNPYELEIKKI